MKKLLGLSLFSLLCQYGMADVTVVTNFTLGDSPVGSNKFTLRDDGTFTSDSELIIPGQAGKSKLTGVSRDGKLISVHADYAIAAGKMTMDWKGASLKVVPPGKSDSVNVPLKSAPDALFSVFHPQLLRWLVPPSNTETVKKIQLLLLDNAAAIPSEVRNMGLKTVGTQTVRTAQLKLAGLDIDVAFAEKSGNFLGLNVPVQTFKMETEGSESVFRDPVEDYPELSQPRHKVKPLIKTKMKTRDGAELVMDIVQPAESGKYPVILARTPYGRATAMVRASWWAKRGYVVVSQDVRGMGESTGTWDPFMSERMDGYDTVQWIAAQPWCDGNVGMIGGSYGGYVQWAAAVEKPAALKCIIPQVSPPDPMYNIPYSFGTFFLSPSLWWAYIVRGHTADFSKMQGGVGDVTKLATLPLSKVAKAYMSTDVPFWETWLKRDRPSKWIGANYQSDMAATSIPALHISGWWDGDGIGTRTNWAIMQKAGKTNQWLIYGPWEHGFNTKTKFGDQDYGSKSLLELDSLYLRWFDTWLKGREIGLNSIPHVKTFVTGANEWRTSSQWPANGLPEQSLYLNSDKTGHKSLSASKSKGRSDISYKYDPAQVGDLKKMTEASNASQASTVVRTEDLVGEELVFKTEVLKKPLEVGGPIRLDLYFKTTAKDADFFAELVDIDEKGTMRLVAMPGALRASYFGRMDDPKPLIPGKVYPVTIEIWDTAHQFKAGHRLGVVLNSNLFPTYNRNLGLGEPIATATKMIKAKHTILIGGNTPSRLRFYPLSAKSGAK